MSSFIRMLMANAVGVEVGDGVEVDDGVAVGLLVGDGVLVGVAVSVAVGVGLGVAVGVLVCVLVLLGVKVGVWVGVWVTVGVVVGVGVLVGSFSCVARGGGCVGQRRGHCADTDWGDTVKRNIPTNSVRNTSVNPRTVDHVCMRALASDSI